MSSPPIPRLSQSTGLGAPLHAPTLSWPSALPVALSVFQCHPLQSSDPRRLPKSPEVCSLHQSPLWCPACRIVVTPTHLLMPRPPGADRPASFRSLPGPAEGPGWEPDLPEFSSCPARPRGLGGRGRPALLLRLPSDCPGLGPGEAAAPLSSRHSLNTGALAPGPPRPVLLRTFQRGPSNEQ